MLVESDFIQDVPTDDFDCRVRSYYLGCAHHVERLAPIPEFRDVLTVLGRYVKSPSAANLDWLRETYDRLKDDQSQRRDYGYTAIGQFYHGLLNIMQTVIEGTDSALSSDTALFAEAVFCAVYAIDRDAATAALLHEYQYQNDLYKQLFN